jgi:type IV pilus assembly protein PilW
MKSYRLNSARIRGFSLVELMVALTIGLIILAAVSMLFVNSKKTYTTQDRLARLQENARFAMQFIIKDLRLTGYYGCVDEINADSVNNTLNSSTSFAYNAQIPLEGLNSAAGTWYPSGSATLPSGIASGTDAIAIRMGDASSSAYIDTEMPNSSAELKVNSVTGFSDGDIIMVSDCTSTDIMQITQVQTSSVKLQHNSGGGSSPGNSTQKLSKAYSPSGNGTRIMKFMTRQYFIRTGASGNPALFRQDNTSTPVELVDGVESMQVLYGKNTDGIVPKVPNVYLKAGAAGLQSATDWSSVVSVRIGILAKTVNDKDTDIDSGTYDVDGDGTTDFTAPGDHNKRRIFQAVVQLRNL